MAGAAAAAVVSVGSSWHGEPRPLSPRKASTPRATTEGDRYQVLADTGSEPQTCAASPWMRVGGGQRPRPWAPALSALGIWIGVGGHRNRSQAAESPAGRALGRWAPTSGTGSPQRGRHVSSPRSGHVPPYNPECYSVYPNKPLLAEAPRHRV